MLAGRCFHVTGVGEVRHDPEEVFIHLKFSSEILDVLLLEFAGRLKAPDQAAETQKLVGVRVCRRGLPDSFGPSPDPRHPGFPFFFLLGFLTLQRF